MRLKWGIPEFLSNRETNNYAKVELILKTEIQNLTKFAFDKTPPSVRPVIVVIVDALLS